MSEAGFSSHFLKDLLLSLSQDGHPLGYYGGVLRGLPPSVLELWHFKDLFFLSGLDDLLSRLLPAGATTCTLAQYLDYEWLGIHGWKYRR